MKSVLPDTENRNSPIFVTKRSSILSMFTKDNKINCCNKNTFEHTILHPGILLVVSVL